MVDLADRKHSHLAGERSMLKENTVLRQYLTCIDAINDLFQLAPDQCYQLEGEEGVGCCDNVSLSLANLGLDGNVGDTIKAMRQYLA